MKKRKYLKLVCLVDALEKLNSDIHGAVEISSGLKLTRKQRNDLARLSKLALKLDQEFFLMHLDEACKKK